MTKITVLIGLCNNYGDGDDSRDVLAAFNSVDKAKQYVKDSRVGIFFKRASLLYLYDDYDIDTVDILS